MFIIHPLARGNFVISYTCRVILGCSGSANVSYSSHYDMRESILIHKNIYGATCFFAAANQDALEVGEDYGFDRDTSLQVDTGEGTCGEAFRACTNSSLRCATQEPTNYTMAERDASCCVDEYNDYNDDNDYNSCNGSDDNDDNDDYGEYDCPACRLQPEGVGIAQRC